MTSRTEATILVGSVFGLTPSGVLFRPGCFWKRCACMPWEMSAGHSSACCANFAILKKKKKKMTRSVDVLECLERLD